MRSGWPPRQVCLRRCRCGEGAPAPAMGALGDRPQPAERRFCSPFGPCLSAHDLPLSGGVRGGGHKALVVGSVSLWRCLLASRP